MRRFTTLLLFVGLAGAATIPRPAPEFVLKTPGGDFLLSQTRGKVVLLMFMFTTCPHCQNSTQGLSTLQREYGPRGFQVLGAAFNDLAPQLVPGFINKFRPTFPVGSTSRSTVHEYLQVSVTQPFSVPVFVFIDKKGMIRAQHMADDFFKAEEKNTRAMIESLLKEPVQVQKKKASR